MITRSLILVLLSVLLSSCLNWIKMNSIKNSQQAIENCYQVSGLFNHFPESISNKSYIRLKSCIPTKTFDPESVYSAYLFLFISIRDNINVVYPKTFISKTNYLEPNFIIDDSFGYYKYYDKTKVRNIALPGKYPIPYFENFDFGLGFERTDLRNSGILLINDKYNVPEDLEVYVLKAGSGYFWEIEFEQERPKTLGKWKNGYSSGIAISKKLNLAVYWMMAW